MSSAIEKASGDSLVRQLATFIRNKEMNRGDFVESRLRFTLDPRHLQYLNAEFMYHSIATDMAAVPVSLPSRDKKFWEAEACRRRERLLIDYTLVSDSKPSLLDDIRLIYSFCACVDSLRLLPNSKMHIEIPAGMKLLPFVDLQPFKVMTRLDLVKVSPNILIGFDVLQAQLCTLRCQQVMLRNLLLLLVRPIVDSIRRRKGKEKDNGTRLGDVLSNASNQSLTSIDSGSASDTPTSIDTNWWPCLEDLGLSRNLLSELDDELIPLLSRCTSLDLSYNSFTRIPSCMKDLIRIKKLNFSHNLIHDISDIGSLLGSIHDLDLGFNHLKRIGGLEKLWELRHLSISHNKLSDMEDLMALSSLPELKRLDITGNVQLDVKTARIRFFGALGQRAGSFIMDGSALSMMEKLSLRWDGGRSSRNHSSNASNASSTRPSSKDTEKQDTKTGVSPIIVTKKIKKTRPSRTALINEEVLIDETVSNSISVVQSPFLSGSALPELSSVNTSRRRLRATELNMLTASQKLNASDNASSRSLSETYTEVSAMTTQTTNKNAPSRADELASSFKKKVELIKTETGPGYLRALIEIDSSASQSSSLTEYQHALQTTQVEQVLMSEKMIEDFIENQPEKLIVDEIPVESVHESFPTEEQQMEDRSSSESEFSSVDSIELKLDDEPDTAEKSADGRQPPKSSFEDRYAKLMSHFSSPPIPDSSVMLQLQLTLFQDGESLSCYIPCRYISASSSGVSSLIKNVSGLLSRSPSGNSVTQSDEGHLIMTPRRLIVLSSAMDTVLSCSLSGLTRVDVGYQRQSITIHYKSTRRSKSNCMLTFLIADRLYCTSFLNQLFTWASDSGADVRSLVNQDCWTFVEYLLRFLHASVYKDDSLLKQVLGGRLSMADRWEKATHIIKFYGLALSEDAPCSMLITGDRILLVKLPSDIYTTILLDEKSPIPQIQSQVALSSIKEVARVCDARHFSLEFKSSSTETKSI